MFLIIFQIAVSYWPCEYSLVMHSSVAQAHKLNPLSATLLFLLNETSRYNVVDYANHVFLVLFLMLSLSLRYAGPIPCRVLYTIVRSVKQHLYLIGNQ